MATSEISLTKRMTHEPPVPLRTTNPVTAHPTPPPSKAGATPPTFTAVLASITAPAASTAPPASTAPAAATAVNAADSGSPFGANPWLTDPTGSGPGPVTHYNPVYFATPQTAQTVAQMVGGTVVSMDQITTAPGSPFQQDEPNLMGQLPHGGL